MTVNPFGDCSEHRENSCQAFDMQVQHLNYSLEIRKNFQDRPVRQRLEILIHLEPNTRDLCK